MIKKTLCFSNPAYLRYHLKQLVICKRDGPDSEERIITRPIEDIGVMVIESLQVTVSSALISALMENDVAMVFCDSKHMPSGMVLPMVGHTEQSERTQAQIQASLPLRKQLWQQTVIAKIRNQASVLRSTGDVEVGNMDFWASNVKSGDSDNLEGRAAVYYWKNLFPEFGTFRRNPDEDGINSLLNYGYAILRAIVARSLVISGLLPVLGIFHKNKYNPYCLADDIMEPYRPYVDLLVLDIIRNHGVAEINPNTKKMLLSLPTVDVRINNLTRPLMIAVSMTTASLARCYLGEIRKIQYPEI